MMNDDTINRTNHDMLDSIERLHKEFIAIIDMRLGILIKNHQLDEMDKTILKFCIQFNYTPEHYLEILRHCPENSPELEHLVTGITVGETYFFRDSRQMKILHEAVLPKLIQSKRQKNNLSLRIWSAGCSSGEEIYTIAMMLIDLLPDIDQWHIQLLGTDINTLSLRKAIEGSYSEWSMRSISDDYKQKYFDYKDKKYSLHSDIRDYADFLYLNLNDDTYPSISNNTNAQDLILCRNVLIYFNYDKIELLMQKLAASIVEDGFLLLGASDPISIKNTALSSCSDGTLFLHSHQKQIKKVDSDKKNPVKILFSQQHEKSGLVKTPVITAAEKPLNAASQNLICTLLDEGHWLEAIKAINDCHGNEINPAFLLNSKASALANLGKLNDAETICHECLKLYPANLDSYFTLAMIYAEKGDSTNAESCLRKSLFLDHSFVAGHFQLGLLLIKNKKKSDGLKSLNNALSIALSKNPAQIVNGIKGLDYGKLTEILKHEIEIYT